MPTMRVGGVAVYSEGGGYLPTMRVGEYMDTLRVGEYMPTVRCVSSPVHSQ